MNTSAPRSTCTLAVVSLCFGIAAWTVLPFVGAIVAVVCGHLARRDIRQTVSEPLDGDGLELRCENPDLLTLEIGEASNRHTRHNR